MGGVLLFFSSLLLFVLGQKYLYLWLCSFGFYKISKKIDSCLQWLSLMELLAMDEIWFFMIFSLFLLVLWFQVEYSDISMPRVMLEAPVERFGTQFCYSLCSYHVDAYLSY